MSFVCATCEACGPCPDCDGAPPPGDGQAEGAELAAIRERSGVGYLDPAKADSYQQALIDRSALLRMVDRLTAINADANVRLDERAKWIDELRAKLAEAEERWARALVPMPQPAITTVEQKIGELVAARLTADKRAEVAEAENARLREAIRGGLTTGPITSRRLLRAALVKP